MLTAMVRSTTKVCPVTHRHLCTPSTFKCSPSPSHTQRIADLFAFSAALIPLLVLFSSFSLFPSCLPCLSHTICIPALYLRICISCVLTLFPEFVKMMLSK